MQEGDLERVMAIAASLRDAPQWPRSAYEDAIAADGSPRRIALVAEIEIEVVGLAVASVVLQQTELESIAVVEGEQGAGIGASLLAKVIDLGRQAGATEMVLEVRRSNRAARRLYERAGFLEAGRRSKYYASPIEDAVLLRLQLSGSGSPIS